MVMAYITNELRPGFSLAECCADEKVQAKKGEELYKYLAQTLGVPEKKASMGFYWQTNAEATIVHEYATGDGSSTWQLWEALVKRIEAEELTKVWQIESDLLPVLHRMRLRGVAVDRERLAEVVTHTERQLQAAQAALGEVNVRSSASVREFLKARGIVDGWPLTEKGQPHFSEKWLMTTPPGQLVVAVRKHRTLLESFLRPMLEQHLRNGRVHSEYHQSKDADRFGTITGRLSSTSPNMTQAPGKRQGERGKYFRSMFKPDYGQWVEADFNSAEIRIAAHYSKAKLWLDGFANAVDPHTAVAKALGINRRHAKTINLGLVMGMGAKRLASELGVGELEGTAVLDRYFQGLPELRQLQQQASRRFEQRGWVRTISGRKLRLKEAKAAFTAVNRLTQGGCADLLKSRLVEMDEVARAYPETDLLLSVHDSISWQTADPEADRALRHAMTGTGKSEITFSIPMEIEVGSGDSWGSATFSEPE
jgi:DNA polymerase-1